MQNQQLTTNPQDEMVSVTIPKSQFDFLTEYSKKLQSQDNRATADPIYLVCDVHDVIINEEYSPHGMGHDVEIRTVYKDLRDSSDEGAIEADDLDEYCKEHNVAPDELEKLFVAEMPYIVNAHLTDEGAQLYIIQNKHNLNKPYTYANSLYRCHDMIDLRKFLLHFHKEELIVTIKESGIHAKEINPMTKPSPDATYAKGGKPMSDNESKLIYESQLQSWNKKEINLRSFVIGCIQTPNGEIINDAEKIRLYWGDGELASKYKATVIYDGKIKIFVE